MNISPFDSVTRDPDLWLNSGRPFRGRHMAERKKNTTSGHFLLFSCSTVTRYTGFSCPYVRCFCCVEHTRCLFRFRPFFRSFVLYYHGVLYPGTFFVTCGPLKSYMISSYRARNPRSELKLIPDHHLPPSANDVSSSKGPSCLSVAWLVPFSYWHDYCLPSPPALRQTCFDRFDPPT